jgi:AhpD family alkylhydroperoxidase
MNRVKLSQLAPDFYKAMIALDGVSATGLDPDLADLVRLRASQVNNCAYCVDMHTLDLVHRGGSAQKASLVCVWREARSFFSDREQAAFELTESITLLSDTHVPDEVYRLAEQHFDEKELAQLISLIIMINAWNRLSVTTRLQPGNYTP